MMTRQSTDLTAPVPPMIQPASTAAEHRLHRRRRARQAMSFVAWPAAFSAVLLMLWQLIVDRLEVSTTVLPTPVEIAEAIGANWNDLLSQTWPTLFEIVAGFGIAVAAGVLTAIVITAVPLIDKMVRPLLVASLVVPKVAIAPLFVIWFGFGYTPKILVTALIAYFPIVVDTALGLKSLSREMRLLMRSMGAGRVRAFLKITFPNALPNVFAGLKVGMALAVVGAIVAEFVQSSEGLGFLLLQANQNLDTPLFFAGIVVLTVVGVVLYVSIEVLEWATLRSRG